ncbi:hypothetical protein G159_10100 [Planococcus glaciei CHR43]|uniref:prepilin-type N-terminal cleavage/methylation domain-containing protein n=1 Tax=Planococcus glaciei TaxID=459472 RepID=UPI0003DEFB14|nr:prepilin-type N-terminal cleavage/methylation domain-containing protein [Planococcus glaciei]ETP68902.1 hypothetical protein G159_10100 [Planococcus glaciei CHR43]
MKKFLQKKLKEQKGMTLIELLAVIVIIAIIAAIAIPAIGNIIDNSRVGAAKSDALNALSAATLYLADNPNETTVELSDLVTTSGNAYLDDAGTLDSFVYTVSSDTVIAVATPTGITVNFGSGTTGVSKAAISALPTNTSGAATGESAGISVTR